MKQIKETELLIQEQNLVEKRVVFNAGKYHRKEIKIALYVLKISYWYDIMALDNSMKYHLAYERNVSYVYFTPRFLQSEAD